MKRRASAWVLGVGVAASIGVFVGTLVVAGFDVPTMWVAGGYAIAVLGVVIVLRALVFDPSAGVARCPECLYAMDADEGLRCPECGSVAASDEHLVRARRRWRLAGVGVLLAAGAVYGGLLARECARAGFWGGCPKAGLIAVLPWAPEEAWRELELRITSGGEGLARWEHSMLASRCAATVESERDVNIRLTALDMLLYLEPESTAAVRAFRAATRDADDALATWAIDRVPAASAWGNRELAALIGDDAVGPARRAHAIWEARFRESRDEELVRAIVAATADESEAVREAARAVVSGLQDG